MMKYLLDTNVINESVSKASDGNVLSWLEKHSEECAISHGLTLVTRNTKDFPPEVASLNPWM